MDSPNVQEQSTLVILPVESEYEQLKPAIIEEKADKLKTEPSVVEISITECDDPASEGDTLVEVDTLAEGDTLVEDPPTAPVCHPESTFNGKEWSKRLAGCNIFEPQVGSHARSRSCTGRIQGNADSGTSLLGTLEKHEDALAKQTLRGKECSERLETLKELSENHTIPRHRAASAANTTSFQSISIPNDGHNHRRSSFGSSEDRSTSRDRRALSSMSADQSHVPCRTLNVHQVAVGPVHLNEDQEGITKKDSISVLDILNALVRGCHVMERMLIDPHTCFATNRTNSQRCTRPTCKKQERTKIVQRISQSVAEMAKCYVSRDDLGPAKSYLKKFANLAICSQSHRKEYYAAIDNIDQVYLCSASDYIDENLSAVQQDGCAESIISRSPATDPTTALTKFNEIFPQAKQWFEDASHKCLWRKATKAKNPRCKNRISAAYKGMIEDRFEKLRNMGFEQSTREASQFIGELADLAFCGGHHRRQARAKVQDSLGGILLQNQGESILSSVKRQGKHGVSHDSIDRVGKASFLRRSTRSPNVLIVDSANAANDRFNFDQGQAGRQSSRKLDSYIPTYERWETIDSRAVADDGEWILKQAKAELTNRELKWGYIYAYWNRTVFGAHKIGFTGRDVDKRIQEWESQCKHAAKKVYPAHDEVAVQVPYAERIEKLIHADLRKHRHVEHDCHGCSKSHDEWFKDVDKNQVKDVIEKWTQWMMTNPYEQKGGKMVLSKSAEDILRSKYKETANSPPTNANLQAPKPSQPRRTSSPQTPKYIRDAVKRGLERRLRSAGTDSENQPASSHRYNLRSGGETAIFNPT